MNEQVKSIIKNTIIKTKVLGCPYDTELLATNIINELERTYKFQNLRER